MLRKKFKSLDLSTEYDKLWYICLENRKIKNSASTIFLEHDSSFQCPSIETAGIHFTILFVDIWYVIVNEYITTITGPTKYVQIFEPFMAQWLHCYNAQPNYPIVLN